MPNEWRITYTHPTTSKATRETVEDDPSGRGAERVTEMVSGLINSRNYGITVGYYVSEETN